MQIHYTILAARHLLVAALAVLGSLSGPFLGSVARAEDPRIGDRAPALDLPIVAGAVGGETRAKIAPGQVTIVDFSATWCAPCRAAFADLTRIGPALGVALVVVDPGEPKDVVVRHYAKTPMPVGARIALDPDEAASRLWGHHRYPTTFLVGADGVIRFINRGYGPGYGARIEARLRALLPPR